MNHIKKKVVFVHSLNNFTGSPNILSIIIKGFGGKRCHATLLTSKGDGFLSNIVEVKYKYTCYKWTNNTIYTFLLLILSQVQVFFYILFSKRKNTVYYINTIVPFGAALACKLTGKEYIYHVHENMQQNKLIYKLLRWTYKTCNRKTIFVSDYLKDTALSCQDSVTIYNSLPKDFTEKATLFLQQNTPKGRQTILMVASFRRFKGIYEFVELAKRLPQYSFELVLATIEEDIKTFVEEIGVVTNLTVYCQQKNMHPFYQRAKLLLQLTHPELWVETFGLTILEAMTYSIPAIVPNVGGPLELIDNGLNGYTINPHDIDLIALRTKELMENSELYKRFSDSALQKSIMFSEQKMISAIEAYINS